MQSDVNEYILELKGITKEFPGVKALDEVELHVKRGTVHALMGENGAGKSTLMKIINGTYTKDSGEIRLNAQVIEPKNQKHMLEMGIATIYQELNPVPELSIAENIYLGREPRVGKFFVDYKKMYQDAQDLIDSMDLKYDAHMRMGDLSISDMQLIEMVKAISRNAQLIIMDEPTSSITESETEILFTQINRLRAAGISIIYISHKMDEIFQICDDLTIFRDGRNVHACAVSEINRDMIIKYMVGREIDNIYPKESVEIGDVVFEVKDFNKEGLFSEMNFSSRAGEIVGIAGLVGAGRTEFFRSVCGLDSYDSGEVYIKGEKIKIIRIQDAIEHGLVMTPEDRKNEGLVLCRSVKENITLAYLKEYKNKFFVDRKKEETEVEEKIKDLSIRVPHMNTDAVSLSGGNQQKVVLAKWLLCQPVVMILDEPTRGIDVGAKSEIYKIMCMLAKNGVSIIMISSELPELLGMCDRIVVVSKGKISGELSRSEFEQSKIMALAMKGYGYEEA